jgi:hypothetical protein
MPGWSTAPLVPGAGIGAQRTARGFAVVGVRPNGAELILSNHDSAAAAEVQADLFRRYCECYAAVRIDDYADTEYPRNREASNVVSF